MPIRPLKPNQVYRRCNLKGLRCKTSAELKDLQKLLGQERALQALEVGLGVQSDGFNLFALGSSGLGRHNVVKQYLEALGGKKEPANEWCYANNFTDPKRPRALCLPAGRSKQLVDHMEQLVQELRVTIAAALESDEFRARREAVEQEFKEEQEAGLRAIQESAQKHGVAMIHTPAGIGFAPSHDGDVLKPEEFQKLPAKKREHYADVIGDLQDRLQELMKEVPRHLRESQKRVQELNREAITFAVNEPIEDLKRRYNKFPKVVEYLDAVKHDVIEHSNDFIASGQPGMPGGPQPRATNPFDRYKVNLLVAREQKPKTPIVSEVNATYHNLIGQVEHASHMGALVTDFRLIKPGALHRANGGYLLLDARRLLQQPFAYEALKQALRTKEIRIESPGQALSLVSTVTLEPEPIPLDVKVILIGERPLYYMLCRYDPEFRNLFKIGADFAETIAWTEKNEPVYARFVATLAKRNSVRPLSKAALKRFVEHGARLCGDSSKLSIRVESLADVLREADYWANRTGKRVITALHIQQAIDAHAFRNSRIREHMLEETLSGTMLIDTEGTRTGQVNGLAVLKLGNYTFGKPNRITATVASGKGEVVDIEREVRLGGALHSKGVLILNGILRSRFGQKRPLALSARLTFEQSYGGVDGDSASSAELYALLSALADLPINQAFAVTGSVNQHGEIQAIGGVNEKIEGFFDLCAARGLTGAQGVLIPKTNVRHLMLAPRVVDAIRKRQFFVYGVSTVEEGIEILTGIPAGRRHKDKTYASESVFGRVEKRLAQYAKAPKDSTRKQKNDSLQENDR